MEQIPFNIELDKFYSYFKANSRSVLSARFGDGKTSFLNSFREEHKNDFFFLTIYPLHYQVADNKDIFEYIKRDILLQLLSNVDVDDDRISVLLTAWQQLQNKPCDFLSEFLSVVGAFGAPIAKGIGKLLKVYNKVKESSEDTKSNKIDDYLKSFEEEKGSIYEFDPISILICELVQKFKEKKTGQAICLIVEDLDRIDPGQIFRILNVLSANIDCENTNQNIFNANNKKNKFDLDKVLLVCDYDNIGNIYHHLYGEKTDFNGYFSKFTLSPFRYSLKESFGNFVRTNLSKEITQYENLTKSVIKAILNKYTGSFNEKPSISLRCLSESIEKQHKDLLKDDISVFDNRIELRKDKPFLLLLTFLNHIGIDFQEIYKGNKNVESELCLLIDSYWLLMDKYFVFSLDENVIKAQKDVEGNGMYHTLQNSCIQNKQIKSGVIGKFVLKNMKELSGLTDWGDSILPVIYNKVRPFIITNPIK